MFSWIRSQNITEYFLNIFLNWFLVYHLIFSQTGSKQIDEFFLGQVLSLSRIFSRTCSTHITEYAISWNGFKQIPKYFLGLVLRVSLNLGPDIGLSSSKFLGLNLNSWTASRTKKPITCSYRETREKNSVPCTYIYPPQPIYAINCIKVV